MSKDRQIDDKDLKEVAGAGEAIPEDPSKPPAPPDRKGGDDSLGVPDKDDTGGGDHELGP